MLSIPTLWTVFITNFLALGLIWAYVMRSYPNLEAARFWTTSAFAAVAAGLLSMLRIETTSMLPLVAAGTMLVFAACLDLMGVRRFYGLPVSWRLVALITGGAWAGLTCFIYVFEITPLRMLSYSLGQGLPMILMARLLLSKQDIRNPGARLAGGLALLLATVVFGRVLALLFGVNLSVGQGGAVAPFVVLGLLFLAMSINFGFLLMTVDRLRSEVADLALLDDLTGVANRRHLLQRLTEECARAQRSGQPFALLVIDLDGFKAINDTHGHAAGDACLRHFTLMAQSKLRPVDMLARTGGDEFCIVLPGSSLHDGALVARRLLQVCRQDAELCGPGEVPLSISIGVAQWTPAIGESIDDLIGHADHALYSAKKEGKNRHAVYGPAPSVAPELGDIGGNRVADVA